MKRNLTKKITILNFLIFFAFSINVFSSEIQSKSSVNWITRTFSSDIELDTSKIKMPSGKKDASAEIKSKMPKLIQGALISVFTDNNKNIESEVINEKLTSDEIFDFISGGYKTPDVFTTDAKKLKTKNTLNLNTIASKLVRHTVSYTSTPPVDYVPSRAYSGIIIDARGKLSVHGEYVSEDVKACFFPKIWDSEMNVIFEKNTAEPEIVKSQGLVLYGYTDLLSDYEKRVGSDPLYIKAYEVYGRNRTDPIIRRSDALKIITVPENIELLRQGKVVILLDKENLIYDIEIPERDNSYYVKYQEVQNYFFENKIPDVEISDTVNGILFSVNLNFYPDSPELLPDENSRIEAIAENLKKLLTEDGYTILVEGHTADVGKPVGQLNLSIERTRTVMNALIAQGIDESLFTYKGYGGTMPVASNLTEEGRAQNRRVDITARPRATYIQRDW